MQVKITKRMVKEINERLKNTYYFDSADFLKLPFTDYRRYVDSFRDIEDSEFDYDINGHLVVKFIRVNYKDDMYAMPAYITMSTLREAFHNAKDNSIEEFFKSLDKMLEI